MKLVVAGCSFSDRTQVLKSYGDHLAELTGREYLHHAGGCGSNDRSMRLITTDIMLGRIVPGDHVILQITSAERKEIFSSFNTHTAKGKAVYAVNTSDHNQSEIVAKNNNTPAPVMTYDEFPLNDIATTNAPVKNFIWSRYKFGSHSWQNNIHDSTFHLHTEERSTDPVPDSYIMWTRLAAFQALLETKNISYTILYVNGYIHRGLFSSLGLVDIHRDGLDVDTTDLKDTWLDIQLSPSDHSHLSEKGHRFFAEWLNNKITWT